MPLPPQTLTRVSNRDTTSRGHHLRVELRSAEVLFSWIATRRTVEFKPVVDSISPLRRGALGIRLGHL